MKITLQKRKSFKIQGNLLVATLVIGVVLGTTLAAYLTLTGDATNRTIRSMVYNSTVPILEAGLEEALAHIHEQGLSSNWGTNGWTLTNNIYMKKRTIGDGYFVAGISNTVPPVVFSRGYATVPIIDQEVTRTVILNTKNDSLFAKGMVAKGEIDMNGNNVMVDSFDSSDPNFSTAGGYDPSKTKDNGDVATNSGLVNSLSVGNANIFGKVSTGPGGSISVGPSGAAGSMAWQNSGNTGIQPGWSSDDMNVSFPDVELPPGITSAPLATSGTVGGTDYAVVLGNGDYRMNSLSLSGGQTKKSTMYVDGHARLYVQYGFSMSGQAEIIIGNNGSLQLYVDSASASIGGNGVANNPGNATNFFYYGTQNNTSLSFSGNGEFTGVIYAPYAAFALNGGGSGTQDFIGASITETVQMNGHFNFHYDENLKNMGPNRGYIVSNWEEIHVTEPDWQTYFPL